MFRARRTRDRRPRSRAASRAAELLDDGRSSARSARSSRVPCRNSSGPIAARRGARRARSRASSADAAETRGTRCRATGKRCGRMRARRHPAAERLAAREQRQPVRMRRRRAATASRTARLGDLGPIRRAACPPPCTETPSAASRSLARRAPCASAAMNACRIPAPAPCASTSAAPSRRAAGAAAPGGRRDRSRFAVTRRY